MTKPLISFTNACTGDLGIKVGDRVVAQYFEHGTEWHIFDLVYCGNPYQATSLQTALNLMLALANREKRKAEKLAA